MPAPTTLSDFCIRDCSTLGWEGDVTAQRYMEEMKRRAIPLLRRRGWVIGELREFYPKDPHLLGLNVNKGQKIFVRMRSPRRKHEFFPLEHVLGTLLHEMTHNEISPHNPTFYKLMNVLVDEAERDELQAVANHSANRTTTTLEQRGTMGSSTTGYRLGGSETTPRTAEGLRLARISAFQLREALMLSEQSAHTGCSVLSAGHCEARATKMHRTEERDDQRCGDEPDWVCPLCTFQNCGLLQNCEVCDTAKPVKIGVLPAAAGAVVGGVTNSGTVPDRTVIVVDEDVIDPGERSGTRAEPIHIC